MPSTLHVTAAGNGVTTITLARPGKKNAIDSRMWDELEEALRALRQEVYAGEVRCVVVTGEGDGFCSGADLTDPARAERPAGPAALALGMLRVNDVAIAWHRLPVPTIAAVNGVAAGAGCNLALGADIVVASDRARFTEIFARRGLVVDFGGSYLLPRLVGLHRAKELVFTGRVVDAAEAASIGLVNRVVAHAELMPTVARLAAEIAAGPPIALRYSKAALNASLSHTLEEALDFEGVAQGLALSSADVAEALAAFVDKREPKFTGR